MGAKTALARTSSNTLDGVQYKNENGCPEAMDPSQHWARPLASALILGPLQMTVGRDKALQAGGSSNLGEEG